MVFDAHLMIENPDNYIKEFVDAGCDIIVVHQEACKHLHRTIQNIKSYLKSTIISGEFKDKTSLICKWDGEKITIS